MISQPAPLRRVVSVDDEPPARQTLRLLLGGAPDFEIVAECGHGDDAVRAVRAHHPDVLFLDVQMPGMDGFGVLRAIGPSEVPALVFMTAYDRYALQAFETHALDYLLKPFSDERFTVVLDRIRGRLKERDLAMTGQRLSALLAARRPVSNAGHLVVRDGSKTLVIPQEDILWIEADDYYVRVHTSRRRTLVRETLRALLETLDGDRFVRIHRSAIVNLDCIRQIEPLASGDQRLVLADGTDLRVSRTYRADLQNRLTRS